MLIAKLLKLQELHRYLHVRDLWQVYPVLLPMRTPPTELHPSMAWSVLRGPLWYCSRGKPLCVLHRQWPIVTYQIRWEKWRICKWKLTSFRFEYTASASNPSSPSCSLSLTCLLTHIYPFKPSMRSTPHGNAMKWLLSRRMRTGGTATNWPFRSFQDWRDEYMYVFSREEWSGIPFRIVEIEYARTWHRLRKTLVLQLLASRLLRRRCASEVRRFLVFFSES